VESGEPQISGHDYRDDDGRRLPCTWRTTVERDRGYAAIAAMGLAFTAETASTGWAVRGSALPQRLPGHLTNRSRRYCSDRCATRANVAAYRARNAWTDRSEQHGPGGAQRPARQRERRP